MPPERSASAGLSDFRTSVRTYNLHRTKVRTTESPTEVERSDDVSMGE